MRIAAALLLVGLGASPAHAQDFWDDPFHGVRHLHRVTGSQDLHVLVVDLCAAGVSLRATGDGERRRTVSSFGELVGAQAAINGDFFSYEDYSTDGPAMSGGARWGGADHGYVSPIAFGPRRVSMPPHEIEGAPIEPWMREIVSGHPSILVGGAVRDNNGDPLCSNRHPRTAVGISADHRTLILAVVDGRAPGRAGMNCDELAGLLAEFGAHDGTNLDGGGSSTMWLAGAGVVNHPSDGRERVTGNHLALYATGAGEGAHCPNARPDGWLDAAACDGVRGWARDVDAPGAAIDVHVYLGGLPGDPAAVGYPVRADQHRDDLCTAIGECAHGFSMLVPHGLMDGAERPVFAFGIDAMGGENALLSGAPQVMRCDRPALPYTSSDGVLRHVPNPDVMAAWRFDFHDVITLADAELATFAHGEDVPAAPRLVTAEGDPKVYVADGPLRRHVPDPAAMAAWRFGWDAIEHVALADVQAMEEGEPLAGRPWLVRGSGPEVYLLDAAPPDEPVIERDAGVGGGGAADAGPRRPPIIEDRDAGSMLAGGCSVAAVGHRHGLFILSLLVAAALARRAKPRAR